jgi:hypothetical protein
MCPATGVISIRSHSDAALPSFAPVKGRATVLATILAAATVPLTIAIGVVLIIVGAIYLFRRRMLLGVVLIIIGILLGGLNIFGVFG